MKHKLLAAIILSVIVTITLAACGSSGSSIEGRWELEGVILEFNAGGAGTETFEDLSFDFNWSVNGDTLQMDYPGNPIESPINYILNLEIHGEPMGEFEFSISNDGQMLYLTDDHGHGHFMLDFSRID